MTDGKVITYSQFHIHICFYPVNDYTGCSTLCYLTKLPFKCLTITILK